MVRGGSCAGPIFLNLKRDGTGQVHVSCEVGRVLIAEETDPRPGLFPPSKNLSISQTKLSISLTHGLKYP